MARSWLITGRGVAKKISNATHCRNRQISESGAEARRNAPAANISSEGEPNVRIVSLKDDAENPAWCAGEPQAVEAAPQAWSNLDESLHCHEVLDSSDHEALIPFDCPILSQSRNEKLAKSLNALCGLPDLQNLGTPPDLQLAVKLIPAIFLVPICLL